MKKVFIISSVFLVFFSLVFLVYNFVFKTSQETNIASKDKDIFSKDLIDDEIFNRQAGEIGLVSADKIISPTLNSNKENIFYFSKNDNAIKRTDFSGKNNIVFFESLTNIEKIHWSPKKELFIYETGTGYNKNFYLNSFEKQSAQILQEGVDEIRWDNLGEKILYKYYDKATKENSINIADPDGKNWKQLSIAPFSNLSLSQIPKTSLVSYWNFPNAQEETSLWTVSLAGGEAQKIFSGLFGADYLWSPDGKKALISSINNTDTNKMNLGIFYLDNNIYKSLDIPTFISKSVWSRDGTTIYYTLPTINTTEKYILPDDYLNKKIKTKDTFWKANVETGKTERIVDLEEINQEIDGENLFLSEDEKTLFFTNKLDSGLYSIGL